MVDPGLNGRAAHPAPGDGPAALAGLVADRRVIICAGPGGVGKTTTAAALAVEGARRGRRTCVVTIDPARRLADALGLEGVGNEPHPVAGDWAPPGELWALMLDTKGTFDEVVGRYAASREQAAAILGNRVYRNISNALSGTQEYMAMEKLYELVDERGFELVVVDTPPTRHALEFLDAPGRLTRFLDNRVFRLLMAPTRAGLRAVNVATQVLLRTISRVVGGEVVRDAIAFFAAFEGMEQGFRARAGRVTEVLEDPGTAFVLVAAPRRDTVEEASYFADRLRGMSRPVAALVVNRMFPRFGPVPPGLATEAGRAGGAPEGLAALVANLAELEHVACDEERYVDALRDRLPGTPVARVPFLPDDVHDVAGLSEVGRYLCPPPAEPPGPGAPTEGDALPGGG